MLALPLEIRGLEPTRIKRADNGDGEAVTRSDVSAALTSPGKTQTFICVLCTLLDSFYQHHGDGERNILGHSSEVNLKRRCKEEGEGE